MGLLFLLTTLPVALLVILATKLIYDWNQTIKDPLPTRS
jgi:hypothetical protein